MTATDPGKIRSVSALTVGSAMVDIIVIVADSDVERMTMHNDASSFLLLEQGRKTEALSITDHTGGGAVNAGVCMARLGLNTATLIKTGQDGDADRIANRLTAEGIDLSAVIRTDALPTGRAVLVSSHDQNATIFTQRGANTLLVQEDLQASSFDGRDLVYITNLSNKSADCFPEIVRLGKSKGAFVAANPGIRQLTSRSGPFMGCLPSIDFLAINRVEAEAMVPTLAATVDSTTTEASVDASLPRLWRVGLEFGGFSMGLPTFLDRLRALGVGTVAVTDGGQGAYLANADGVFFCPALEVEVEGTAGAGDAFSSTLCASLAQGHSPGAALIRATRNAACVVGAIDAQTGLQRAEDLDALAAESGLTPIQIR